MDGEDRDLDKIHVYYPDKSRKGVSKDVIKSKFIADGMTAEEIANECFLSVVTVRDIIEQEDLPELRKAYIIQGIQKIQNVQLHQAHKLMDIESNFKKLRIIQLEKVLEDFIAYYSRHGDFYKRHPVSGVILKNSDGIPMQLPLPNVSKELSQLKDSVTMSEGVRPLIHRLDEMINRSKPEEPAEDPDTFDITDVDKLFDTRE